MHMRREVRWLLWGLWLGCLAFAVWFIVAVIVVLTDDSPLNQLQNLGPLAR
ncbi:hypothetical protein [Streptomyces sp. SAS_270]|uniref:hypothetical protein n=1 Tax=Streptomyces sp. SAS_270 TaxID=3412748 RepID=UPI00403C4EB1